MKTVLIFLIALTIFLILDGIWLGLVARNLYTTELKHLMGETKWIAAGVFYVLFVIVLSILILVPGIQEGNLTKLLINAALFGFITYATYDLTNLATLKDWPLNVTIIDMIWGTFLATATSFGTYLVATNIE